MSQQQPAGHPNTQGRRGAAGVPVRRKSSAAAPVGPPESPQPDRPGDGSEDRPEVTVAALDTQRPARGWAYWRGRLRWVFGLASLGVALLAQKVALDARAFPADSPPLLSWVLYGVAIALFALAMPRAPYLAPQATTPFKSTLRAMRARSRRLFLGLLAGAGVLGLASVPLFVILNRAGRDDSVPGDPGPPVSYGSWLLYVAALLLLGAAWVVWERGAPGTRGANPWHAVGGLPRRTEWAVLGGLLLLAMLFRLPNLDTAPPGMWFDEAMNGIVARDLLLPDTVKAAFISQETQMGALYFYFLGWVTQIFGQADVWPVRLLPALAGSLIAPLLYIIGSRLYGWRVGVAAGVFVAVSVWNITMSRLGLASIPTIALNVGVYACLVQGLRTGRLGYYAGGGVLLGLALQMYYPSQLVPVVLALVFAHLLVTGRMAAFRSVRAGAAAFVVCAVLAAVPGLTFAAQYPQAYTQRAGSVSIFTPEGSDYKPDALGMSIKAHALMFTYRGDRNPRHNLTEAHPMLEWPVSALFVVGLGASVLRLRRWQYFFPVVWLLVAASGGVLSAVFEAPQGHRTMENSVVTALLAGIVAGELWAVVASAWAQRRKEPDGVEAARGALPPRGATTPARPVRLPRALATGAWLGAAVFAGLLVWAGAANYDRYFNRQVVNAAVWNEMQGANREVANVLLRYGNTHRVLVSPVRTNSPVVRYLAPQYATEVWDGPRMLPFMEDRDTVIMVDATEQADLSVIKTVYPGADVQATSFGGSTQAQLYTVIIPAGEMAAARGVRYAVYAGGEARDGTRATMSLDGISGEPPGSTFEMSSTLKVSSSGSYTFDWEPPLDPAPGDSEPVTVIVDGAPAAGGQPVPLAAGLHSLTVRGAAANAEQGSVLVWQSEEPRGPIPVAALYEPRRLAPMGLTAYVRQGDVFDGPPTTMRIDPIVSFYFHNIPLLRPYTTEWKGKLYAPVAGMYTLYTEQISTSRLFVDGGEVLYNSGSNALLSGQVELTAGLHDIRIEHQDLADFSHMYLYWTPPGRDGRYTIPAQFLQPDMAQYPAVPSTGSWPSAEEADDTVWDLNAASGQPGVEEGQTTEPPAEQQPPATPTAEQGPAATAAPGADASPVVPVALLGGPDDAALARPLAGAADEEGNLYVFVEAGKIHKFGPGGDPLASWDVKDAEGNPVTEGAAILVREGRVTLLDSGSSNLISYSPDGEELGRTQLCECFYPRGMSASLDGNLWVADTGLSRVIKVTPEGTLVSTLGEKGTGPGQFVEPAGVWQAPGGTVYVADVGNRRVQSFDAGGKPLAQWPIGVSNARDGSRVVAMPDGSVLVTEQQVQAIVLYDPRGKELARWAYNPGTGPQAPSVIVPAAQPRQYLVLFPFTATAVVFTAAP